MRFLLDMGISPVSGQFLRDQGHDVIHLRDQGLERLPDPDILAKAREEERILITHDLEFGELLGSAGAQLPSVITFRLRNMSPDSVNHYLREILEHHRAILEKGAIMSVSEGQIRIRTLPLRSAE
jgi:predicted nuclease of predicted toxin-antitoxin system